MPTPSELAYLAGVIDGEGTISISPLIPGRDYGHSLRLSVSNTDLRLLTWIADRFGGCVARAGRKPARKQVYQWARRGANAAAVIEAVRPYLIVTAEQARLALEFQTLILPQGPGLPKKRLTPDMVVEREGFRSRISYLNRGVA